MTARVFAARLHGLFTGNQLERQMEDELRAHLEMQTEDNLRLGMTPAEARYDALRRLGALDATRETCRENRTFAIIETFFKDAGYAIRALNKNRAFTAIAILTLALGIGANTAIFSVVQAILLQPLPYKDPSRLILVWNTYPKVANISQLGLSPGDFKDFQKQAKGFAGMAAYIDLPKGFNLTGQGQAERLEARYATSGLLPLLGLHPVAGRNFTPQEDQPGATPSVMISHRLWQSHFGSDPNFAGRTIQLDGRSFVIAGILPREFQLTPTADIWLPVGLYPDDLNGHVHHPFMTVARMKPGATLAAAQSELNALNRAELVPFPDTHRDWKVESAALENPAAARLRPLLLVLFGAVGFVLLIACANVVNLILARNAARQREFAVRIAVGATLPRLLVQLLTESAVLIGVGTALGLLAAGAGLQILNSSLPPNLAALAAAKLNWQVLGFTAATALFTGILCGLIPAFQTLRRDGHSAIKAAGRGSDASGGSIRNALVVAQTSLAIILLLGATLLLRSFYNAINVDPGFQTKYQLALEVDAPALSGAQFAKLTPQQQADLPRKQSADFELLAEHIKAIPGVQAVGAITVLPLGTEFRSASRFVVEGQPLPDGGARPVAETRTVSLGYFAAMGIPLKRGRLFRTDDYGGNNILINEELAHRFWPGQEALGKRLNLCTMFPTPCWLPIVGVVGNVHQYGLDATSPSIDVYFTGGQTPNMIVRTAQDPAAIAHSVIDAIHEEDPNLPVTKVMPLNDLLQNSIAPRRFSATLLGAFAALALLLAAIGIYGVMNYVVGFRTREIGIRVALGAPPGKVWRLITGSAARLAITGMAIGLIGATALMKTLAGLVYGIQPEDPKTIAASAILLAAIILLACQIPARRAARIDPIIALRED